jgi:transcriptional regulator with XRE-family HTH domain
MILNFFAEKAARNEQHKNHRFTTKTHQAAQDLTKHADVSRVMIGKYERGEAIPSIEVAKKIADAFQVSLDYLVGEGINANFDKKTLQRLEDLELLEDGKKRTLYDLMDTYIRDAKARRAYSV